MSLAFIASSSLLLLIKCIILVYDISTFLIYCMLQRPWKKVPNQDRHPRNYRPSSKKENPGDRHSAYVSPYHESQVNTQSLAYGCSSVIELMQRIVMKYKDKRCLGYRDLMMEEDEVKPDGSVVTNKILSQNYKWLNYAQVDKRIDDTMRGLVAQGIKPGDRVLILMENRIEYLFVVHACIRMAAVPLLVPSDSSSNTIASIVFQATPVCFLTSCKYSAKVLQNKSILSGVNMLICAEDKDKEVPMSDSLKIVKLGDIVKQGGEARPEIHRVSSKLTDLAFVVYKSSSTPQSPESSSSPPAPPGIMITHRNLITSIHSLDTQASESVLKSLNNSSSSSAYPSFLPLTTLSELVIQHVMLMNGIAVGYSSPDSLTDLPPGCLKASKPDVTLLRPQMLSSSVRGLDLLRQHTLKHVQTRSLFVKKFFEFCLEYKIYWISHGFDTTIMNVLVFNRIRSHLGGRINSLVIGIQEAEILSPSTESFVQAVTSSSIRAGFSMNEATGFVSLRTNSVTDSSISRMGSCGGLVPGVKVKLVDWPEGDCFSFDHPFPRGEVWITGHTVTRGYFGNPAETEARFVKDMNGTTWFQTGCIGEMDDKGNLRIIDRKENMVRLELSSTVTSLGQAEAIIRSCYFVDNVILLGSSENNFIIALVSPDKESISRLCSKLDIEEGSLDFKEMCADPEIQAEVTRAVIEHGLKGGLGKKMLPSKVKLCHEDWDPESGLVDADMRPIKSAIRNKYHKEISRMFGVIDNSRNMRMLSNNNNSESVPDHNQIVHHPGSNHVAVLPTGPPEAAAVPAVKLMTAEETTMQVHDNPGFEDSVTETSEGMEMQEKGDHGGDRDSEISPKDAISEKRDSSTLSVTSSSPGTEMFRTPRQSVTSIIPPAST